MKTVPKRTLFGTNLKGLSDWEKLAFERDNFADILKRIGLEILGKFINTT
jgi:hypothetical protein